MRYILCLIGITFSLVALSTPSAAISSSPSPMKMLFTITTQLNAGYDTTFWGGDPYMWGGDGAYDGALSNHDFVYTDLHGSYVSEDPTSTDDILIYQGNMEPNNLRCDVRIILRTKTNELVSAKLVLNKPLVPVQPTAPNAKCELQVLNQEVDLNIKP